MGILDEAIREHLELKRQHGADDSELKQLEDQAFGPPERPGTQEEAAAEAPTEFMSQPGAGGDGDETGRELGAESEQEPAEPPPERRAPAAGLADLQEAPQMKAPPMAEDELAEQTAADEPTAEEQSSKEPSAAEHEAIAPSAGSHTTEERHAIADQPTEMFDVEEEFAATEVPAPPDEDLVAEEISEARLGPAEPDAPLEVSAADEDDDDFFDEQRLSDELDQALEAPAEPLSDEHEAISDEPEAVADRTEEQDASEPRTEVHEAVPERDEPEGAPAEKPGSDEDVLEETPDFLEEAPEDDQLWFEQKPPKDFDFDD